MSQVLVALLLVAVAVAAAVLYYVFAIGLVGPLQGGGGQQARQQLILVVYRWYEGMPLFLTLRNVGAAEIDLTNADFFIDGVPQTFTIGDACGSGGILQPRETCIDGRLSAGGLELVAAKTYTLKVATADGAIFSYAVTYGTAG
jgi:hypothetical protein